MEANQRTNQRFADFGELRKAVEENEGVLTVETYEVRDAYPAQRLGRVIREGIAKKLAGEGLGSYPKSLPEWPNEEVRIYKLGSPAADLIDAVTTTSASSDEVIREAVGGDASQTLDKIRELVCG